MPSIPIVFNLKISDLLVPADSLAYLQPLPCLARDALKPLPIAKLLGSTGIHHFLIQA